ncbi:MAG: ATP-binding protein [Candidatus Woesearchaeota archaeon]
MILGKICGKIGTNHFQFIVTHQNAQKFQFVQINHPEHGFVLNQITELVRDESQLLAQGQVIGYKDQDGRIKGLKTPYNLHTEVLEAEDEFIKEIIELKEDGGYLGKLEGKNIPIKLDLQKVLTKHLCVLAKSGAGKSYAVGVLAEEIIERNVPLLIIDPHGEYSSLRYPNSEEKDKLREFGLEPKGYGLQIQEYGDSKLKEDLRPLRLSEKISSYELMKLLPIQLTNTQESLLFSVIKDLQEINFDNIVLGLEQLNSSGKWALIDTIIYLRDLKLFSASPTPLNELIRPGKCTIINLKGISPEIQDVIVYKLMKDLFLARKSERIPPFFCIVEEAHNFAPERGFGKAKSLDILRLISSEGRKFGLGLCVISQRPALVQKTILAQCSTQIIMKVTNPNDLKAITGSIEGITSETENEIQNLPVGSAMVCGIVDRPLMVNIRTRKTQHGGHAIDILGTVKEENQEAREEYPKDIVEETNKFAERNLLFVIPSRMSIKDLQLMSTSPGNKITTYLIPALFLNCEKGEHRFNLLVERIRGKIILDPEKETTKELWEIHPNCHFLRNPEYESVQFEVQLDERIPANQLVTEVGKYCKVEEWKECFIVYHKME